MTKQDMRVEKTLTRNAGFESVGGVFCDGLTSMLAWELMELGHRAGRLELKGEEAAIGGKVTGGGSEVRGSTRVMWGLRRPAGEELARFSTRMPSARFRG